MQPHNNLVVPGGKFKFVHGVPAVRCVEVTRVCTRVSRYNKKISLLLQQRNSDVAVGAYVPEREIAQSTEDCGGRASLQHPLVPSVAEAEVSQQRHEAF